MRRRRAGSSDARSGLTLLEVLVSTAIFLAALTAILQVMQVGHDSHISARLEAEAALRCESVMAELVSGMVPLVPESEQPFEDDQTGNWLYSVEVEDGGATDLLLITVSVEHRVNDNQSNASFTLVRFMRDPQLFIDAAMSSLESEDAE